MRPRIFPQFATHNALTVATVLELAEGNGGFEFQRLHGMGEALYAQLSEDRPTLAYRTYAPVGSHRDLLAYLVRRLLENGANSSFVALAADDAVPVATLLRRPAEIIGAADNARHPNIPLPRDLYQPHRQNSRGIEFGERAALSELLSAIAAETAPVAAASVINGKTMSGAARQVVSPIDRTTPVGSVIDSTPGNANEAISAAREGFKTWSRTRAETRAEILEKAADLLEQRRAHFIALLQREGGKTLDDALSEVREAVDFCRYYAAEGRELFGTGETMPGPTGESNLLRLRGRGVFIAISPWNFPLAIFLGQVTAALMAGNAVVAKPAEQTPLIAAEAIRLLHEAGVPTSALHLVPGDGNIGAALVAHPDIAGVVFTGSTEVARSINRTLAAKDGPIVPLIAETGGINAMIVDATALPEQVADDVVTSAFRSAGQRCSALRLLFVQDDVADRMIEMISGAARELGIGDPRDPATHIGPVIDAEAKQRLEMHIARMKNEAREHFAGTAPGGNYVAPHIFELSDADQTDRGSIRADPACGALPRRSARSRAAVDRTQRLRADARHPLADRRYDRGGDRPAFGRQRLCQPQHDRCCGRRAAVRRPWTVGHGSEGRRAALPGALCDRTDRDDQYGSRRRQRSAGDGRGLTRHPEVRALASLEGRQSAAHPSRRGQEAAAQHDGNARNALHFPPLHRVANIGQIPEESACRWQKRFHNAE